MPFEISVDTKKKKGVMLYSTIQRIDQLQNVISKNKEFSKPLSVAEFYKICQTGLFQWKSGDVHFAKFDGKNLCPLLFA